MNQAEWIAVALFAVNAIVLTVANYLARRRNDAQ